MDGGGSGDILVEYFFRYQICKILVFLALQQMPPSSARKIFENKDLKAKYSKIRT